MSLMNSELNAKAWEIRRNAAKKLDCKVTEIPWKDCLIKAGRTLRLKERTKRRIFLKTLPTIPEKKPKKRKRTVYKKFPCLPIAQKRKIIQQQHLISKGVETVRTCIQNRQILIYYTYQNEGLYFSCVAHTKEACNLARDRWWLSIQ